MISIFGKCVKGSTTLKWKPFLITGHLEKNPHLSQWGTSCQDYNKNRPCWNQTWYCTSIANSFIHMQSSLFLTLLLSLQTPNKTSSVFTVSNNNLGFYFTEKIEAMIKGRCIIYSVQYWMVVVKPGVITCP